MACRQESTESKEGWQGNCKLVDLEARVMADLTSDGDDAAAPSDDVGEAGTRRPAEYQR